MGGPPNLRSTALERSGERTASPYPKRVELCGVWKVQDIKEEAGSRDNLSPVYCETKTQPPLQLLMCRETIVRG